MTAFIYRCFLLLALSLYGCLQLQAQLCSGSLGDPVAHITFGAGTNPGGFLSSTNYNYLAQDCPNDGQYTIRNSTDACFNNTWHRLTSDHTGDPNGYFMLVNASFQPGDFYRGTVGGLCGNTTYEFAAWVINMLRSAPFCPGGVGIKPNLTFSVETMGGSVLATYNSGDIDGSDAPQWKQYGMFFTTPAGTSEVVVRIRNNAPGGCGNDLALDDITFRPCGAKIEANIAGVPQNAAVLCEGTTTTYRFDATVSANYVHPEVQWQESTDNGSSWKNLQGAVATTYTWNGRPAGNYLYRMLVAEKGNINSVACRIASRTLSIKVQPLPVLSIREVLPICPGNPLVLDASINYFDSSRGTFQWSLPAGINIPFDTRDSGNYQLVKGSQVASSAHGGVYRLSARSAAGCENTIQKAIAVLERPVAGFRLPPLICAGSTYTFDGEARVASSTPSNWYWFQDSGTLGTTRSIRASFDQAGTRSIRLAVQAANGCVSDTVSQRLVVQPRPIASFILPEVCLTDPFAQFQNTATVAGGGALWYRWTFGDPAAPGFVATQKDPRYRYSRTGVYPVQLSVTSAAGCVTDSVQMFTVNGASPRAAFTLVNTGALCSADSIRLRNDATVDFGNITRLVIRWKNDSDPAAITTDENPLPGKAYVFSYKPFLTGNVNRFVVRYTVYSGVGCVSETTREVIINKSPEVQMDALAAVCANDPLLQLSQGSERTGLAGKAVYAGSGVGADGRFNPAQAGAGIHSIRYTFTTTAGCTAQALQNQVVFAVPVLSAGPDKNVIAGGSVLLEGKGSGNGLQYTWSPATYLSDASLAQPRVIPQTDMVYRLTARSADGCSASDEVKVTVMPDLFIPNAFSPNGDGINDTWQVPYLESLEGGRVQVFNRYGQVVFENSGNLRWDGRYKGALLPSGAYVYLVQFNNQRRKGVVVLIR